MGENLCRDTPAPFVPCATYHVYCRVARGEFVFDEHDEAVEFIETLSEVRDLDGLTIFAWCLMGNHYHLVLRTGEIARWLNRGLRLELEDPTFKRRVDTLDEAVSRRD